MVDVLAADRDDAAVVRVPSLGIEAHREGARGLHVRGHLGLARDGLVSADGDHEVALVGLASARDAHAGGVRVVRFLGNAASALHVLVGVLGPAAVATQRGLVAGGDLLRGEDVSGTEGAHGIRLDLLGGAECPA